VPQDSASNLRREEGLEHDLSNFESQITSNMKQNTYDAKVDKRIVKQ